MQKYIYIYIYFHQIKKVFCCGITYSMYISDDYMEHLFVTNSSYLNENTTKPMSTLTNKISTGNTVNITLMQQTYLIIVTILALKVLSTSIYR